MTMLSPAATYHAELREQLSTVGRALSFQRAVLWLARGLAVGTIVDLGVVIWAWLRDGGIASLPMPLLLGAPLLSGLATAVGSLFVRHRTPDLARRIDHAARLHERSTTALELGARGAEFPLAIAQMRDAVEHLKRVDLLETFPVRLPRTELLTAFFVAAIAAIVALSPNPWLLRARASNPAITIAREQAQRVQRLADSIQPQTSPELEALRQLVSKGARTIDARSNEPDAALNALQDLEEQVRQMSASDDQLAAALAAIAGALGADQSTQQLSAAINTGDMRQIAQATKDLAQAAASMSSQDQQRLAQVLRDAASRADRVSQNVSSELNTAADALQASSAASAGQSAGQPGQTSNSSSPGQSAAAANQAAADALNQLGDSATAAGERQRASSQLESSRNALERALGRTQSRSGSTGRSSSASSSSQRSQNGAGGQQGDPSQGGGQSQSGDQAGGGTDGTASGTPGGEQGNGGDTGQGGGYSTGGQSQSQAGSASSLDAITSPQQVPGNGTYTPDVSSANPYLGDAGAGSAQASTENVQPSYSSKPTTGSDNGTIPMGLRDLVKDYFSSLDQK